MGWIITGAIIAFIVILMLFRVRLFFSFYGEFGFKFKYLFFTLRIKEREAGKAKKAPEKKEEEQPQKADIIGLLKTLKRYSALLKSTADSALKRMRIDRLYIKLIIKEDNAAKTAILYGEACAVVYPVVSFLGNAIGVKQYEIDIKPVFGEGVAAAEFECVISMRVGSILVVAVSQIATFISTVFKENRLKKSAKDGGVK
jgi:hypothetical protein